ncbi:MAG: glycosyltransferase family 4 protein [Acidimicrobiia bacterium]
MANGRASIRVALDATPLLGNRTGVGEVVAGLVEALAAHREVEVAAYAITWRGRASLSSCLPAGVRAATAPLPARLVRAGWMRADHPSIERWTGAVDIVHATNYVPPPSRSPVLVSVYDLGFVHFPELCTPDALQYPTLLQRGLARGALVHATSDFVADEVRAEFDLPADRVVRIYPGVPQTASGDSAAGQLVAGAPRYVLALGTIEPRKNLPLLVDAFDQIAALDPELFLVVAGQDGWGTDAFVAACDRAAHGSRIRRLGYVSAGERRDLLAGAQVLAYPSKYEGFGFPPLEAMAVGVPVVATRAGALPETTGDAALLVDPDDRDELAGALHQVLDDNTLRATLVDRGRSRARQFTWAAAVDRFIELYRRLA